MSNGLRSVEFLFQGTIEISSSVSFPERKCVRNQIASVIPEEHLEDEISGFKENSRRFCLKFLSILIYSLCLFDYVLSKSRAHRASQYSIHGSIWLEVLVDNGYLQ